MEGLNTRGYHDPVILDFTELIKEHPSLSDRDLTQFSREAFGLKFHFDDPFVSKKDLNVKLYPVVLVSGSGTLGANSSLRDSLKRGNHTGKNYTVIDARCLIADSFKTVDINELHGSFNAKLV